MRKIGPACVVLLGVPLLVALAPGCRHADRFDARSDPAAVVLVQDGAASSLVVVDLTRFEVTRRVRLRSQSFSIDGDNGSRTVASAQCGGLERETDDACGLYRLGSRRVRYVDLKTPNPYDVAVVDGKAYLVHGFADPDGLCTSVVDLNSEALLNSVHVPVDTGRVERAGGRAIAPVPSAPADPDLASAGRLAALIELGGSRPTTFAAGLELSSCTVVASEDGPVIVAGRRSDPSGRRSGGHAVVSINGESDLQRADAPWITKEVEAGCATADGIAIADSSGIDPLDTGHDVFFLDPSTLEPTLTRTLDGMPAAIASWGEDTLIVDGATGELLMYGRGATTPARRLKVSSEPHFTADIVVFDDRDF